MIRPAVLAALQGNVNKTKKFFNLIIISIYLGYNTTVLAYGQTASGRFD